MVVVSRFCVHWWQYRQAENDSWFERRMHLLQRITLPALARVKVRLVLVWQAHRTKMDLVADSLGRFDMHRIDVRLVNQTAKTHPDIWPGADKFVTSGSTPTMHGFRRRSTAWRAGHSRLSAGGLPARRGS